MFCYRHPKIETYLKCGKCDRPICVKCSIPGSVGMRCPDCASLKSTHLYRVGPGRLILTIILALVAGLAGAALLTAVSFFVFFIGPAYGVAVAEVVLRVSGQKRGPLIEWIGIGSIIVGELIVIATHFLIAAAFAPGATHVPLNAIAHAAPGMLFHFLWPLLGIALAISSCFTRLRYF